MLPHVTLTDPQVASVGLSEQEARTKGIDLMVSKLPLSYVPRALAARETRGFIKLIADRRMNRLVGAHILGTEAGEMIQEPTLAITHGIKVDDLAAAFHPYLTLAEGIKLAAQTFTKDVKKLQGRSGLKTWIFSILTNRAKTRGRRDKRSVPFSVLSGLDPEDEPAVHRSRFTSSGGWAPPPERWDEDTPERLLLGSETRALIDHAIAELPAGQRAVITLRDIEGLDLAEICNILEISGTNQRVLLHRARAKIRSALEQHLHRP
ncbi:MAG: sigma-70 family RNA polymerase sigma factor [Acidobacteria bacterium]|nr:sigma-70 family RNA polymerase sigma factor [Acidobacteriota bacterium]